MSSLPESSINTGTQTSTQATNQGKSNDTGLGNNKRSITAAKHYKLPSSSKPMFDTQTKAVTMAAVAVSSPHRCGKQYGKAPPSLLRCTHFTGSELKLGLAQVILWRTTVFTIVDWRENRANQVQVIGPCSRLPAGSFKGDGVGENSAKKALSLVIWVIVHSLETSSSAGLRLDRKP